MKGAIRYDFEAEIWQYQGSGAWHFVTLPDDFSQEIRTNLQWQEEGWGRLKASAKIGHTTWQSAIWYDTKHKAYLLPIKAEIRRKENLKAGERVKVSVMV